MTSAADNTGNTNNNNIAVMNNDQMVSGRRNHRIPGARIFTIVVM